MTQQFRKKPVVIEAMQLTYDSVNDCLAFINLSGGTASIDSQISRENVFGFPELKIKTLEGVMTANEGDWIIKGVKGEFYPCKPDIFESTYDLVYHRTAGISDVSSNESQLDQQMEKEIVEKGLIYPRITNGEIEAKLAEVLFDCHVVPGTTTTVVTAYIPLAHINFTLSTEIMACVDPRNFNAELGQKYGIEKAKASAKNKLWELEGYRLAHSIANS